MSLNVDMTADETTGGSNREEGSGPSGGVAGRTNYAKWDKVATDLVKEVEKEEEQEIEEEKAKVCLFVLYNS